MRRHFGFCAIPTHVTQRVFITLARHAARLQNRIALTGWLHETARNFAVSTVRGEERRRQREQEAVTMNFSDSTGTDDLWKEIAPHLDEALAQLSGDAGCLMQAVHSPPARARP